MPAICSCYSPFTEIFNFRISSKKRLPIVVELTLLGRCSLKPILNSLWLRLAKKYIYPELLAIAIILDRKGHIDINQTFKAPQFYPPYSSTLLGYAAAYGTASYIRMLCKKGANVNILSDAGTPLHQAVSNSSIENIEELIKQKANLEIADHYGRTPLHQAIVYAHRKDREFKAMKLLLKHGANPYAVTRSGSTPLDIARRGPYWYLNSGLKMSDYERVPIPYLEKFMAANPRELYE